MARGEDQNLESGNRVPEVAAALAALVFLVAAELVLFATDRVSQDAVDLVTLCAFGGVAAAALRGVRFPVGQGLSSLAIGVVAALAILHGARTDAGVGPLAPALGAAKSWADHAALPPLFTGALVTMAAWTVQLMLDGSDLTRKRIRRLAVMLLLLLTLLIIWLALFRGISIPATSIPTVGSLTITVPAVTISPNTSVNFMSTFIFWLEKVVVELALPAILIGGLVLLFSRIWGWRIIWGTSVAVVIALFVQPVVLSIGIGLEGAGIAVIALAAAVMFIAMARPLGSKLVDEDSLDDPAVTLTSESKPTHPSASTATTSPWIRRRAVAMVVLTSTGLAFVAIRRLSRRR